jgi:hypothetical protein
MEIQERSQHRADRVAGLGVGRAFESFQLRLEAAHPRAEVFATGAHDELPF